jgi:predicted ribosome quality control (RQC) complex YloA/Tae2 family protein
VRTPGETVHIVVDGQSGVGILDESSRTQLRQVLPSGSGGERWRATLKGAVVLRVAMEFVALARAGVTWLVRAEGDGRLALLRSEVPEGPELSRTTLEARGKDIARALVVGDADARRNDLRRALAKTIARLDRRLQAIGRDLSRTEEADAIARHAELFVAQAARAPRGVTKLVAVDWSSGEPQPVEMPVDPASSAQSQVEGLFKRARRLKNGASIARARLAEAEKIRSELAAVAAALDGEPDAAIEGLWETARRTAPRDFSSSTGAAAPRPNRREQARQPYRAFVAASGARILVGRKAEDNDVLTLRVARPHDLWLHAKGRAGAHVVVPLAKGASCPPDLLVEAAHLAAHFSDARDERVLEIGYAPRRYVRKPRGSAPGFVVVDREKVLILRQEDGAVDRLLAREIGP